VRTLYGHSDWVYQVALSADGYFLASGGKDALVMVWELHTFKQLHTLNQHRAPVVAIHFPKNRAFLLTASLDQNINTWDLQTWKVIQQLQNNPHIQYLTLSNQSLYLAVSCNQSYIKIWLNNSLQ
jgi:WD40 repeat protein